MSARDKLFQVACDDMPVTSDEVNEAIDAYAHELAEEQRRAIEGFDLDDHWAVFYRASDVESLPDLIDPTKENDG